VVYFRAMEPLGPTRVWVADTSSARRAATALLIQELRRGRLILLGTLLTAGLMVLLLTAGRTEDDHRPLFALLFSLAVIGGLVACAVGISQWQRLRVMRAQLPPGHRFEARFGPDHLVLTSEWSESTLHFDGYREVTVIRGWVLLRHRATRVQGMLPLELFPPDDLARLRLVVAGYQPRVASESEDRSDGTGETGETGETG
jgi:hypothetical protein